MKDSNLEEILKRALPLTIVHNRAQNSLIVFYLSRGEFDRNQTHRVADHSLADVHEALNEANIQVVEHGYLDDNLTVLYLVPRNWLKAESTQADPNPSSPTLAEVLKMDWITVVSDPKNNKATAYCDNANRRNPRCFSFDMREDQVIQALTTQGDQFRLEKGPRGLQLFIRQFN